ncbi:MAG: sugar phosphate isomerase/epimerase family protein [Candidatus Nezhaarchaeales archaeon]
MDIYISSLAGILRPLKDFVVRAANEGFKNIEIIDDWGHRLNSRKLKELMELRSSYSLKYLVHAPFDGINISTPQPSLRRVSLKLIGKSMEKAHEIEAKLIVVHSGFKSPFDYLRPETTWNIFLDVLKFMNKVASDLDIYVGIENMPSNAFALIHSHRDAMMLLDKISSLERIKLTFDVGHSNTISNDEVREFLLSVGDYIIHVHVHDNNGENDDHLPIGSGSINWRVFADIIKKLKLVGGLTLEVMNIRAAKRSLNVLMKMLG